MSKNHTLEFLFFGLFLTKLRPLVKMRWSVCPMDQLFQRYDSLRFRKSRFWKLNQSITWEPFVFRARHKKKKIVSRFQVTSSAQNFNNLEQKTFQPMGKNRYFRFFDFFHRFPQFYIHICYWTWQKLSFQRFWRWKLTEGYRKWPKKNGKFSEKHPRVTPLKIFSDFNFTSNTQYF